MDNLARKLEQGDVHQQTGTVLRSEGSEMWVCTSRGEYLARRAVSCLVAPEPDDHVLVACEADGSCWVLAVLEREPGATARVVADGDLQLQVPAGRFTVAAQEGMSLVSGRDTTVVSAKLDVNAVEGNVALGRLSYFGRAVLAEVDRVKLLAQNVDAVLERWSQRVKRCFRRVEEFDQLRAERIDYRAERNMSLHAEHAAITAKGLCKVDGEQIHLG